MDGAVFAMKSHTDLVNSLANGAVIEGRPGCTVAIENAGTVNAKYLISLDAITKGQLDGTSSPIKIYEKAVWDASSPQDAIVAVYDASETPQPKTDYFTGTIYIREPIGFTLDPASLSFVAEGEFKSFSIDIQPAGQAWTLEVFGSGFSTDISSGGGDDGVIVTAAENPYRFDRMGRIVVTAGNVTKEIALLQDKAVAVTLEKTTDSFFAGNVPPPIITHSCVVNSCIGKWSAVVRGGAGSWLKIGGSIPPTDSTQTGAKLDSIHYKPSINTGGERVEYIDVTDDIQTVTLTITQAAPA